MLYLCMKVSKQFLQQVKALTDYIKYNEEVDYLLKGRPTSHIFRKAVEVEKMSTKMRTRQTA